MAAAGATTVNMGAVLIEAKALRKLRHPTRSDQLRSFLLED